MAKARISHMTLRRAIQTLRQRGVAIRFSRETMRWHLVNSQPNWQSLTLAELVDAGCLTREAAMILGWKVEQVK